MSAQIVVITGCSKGIGQGIALTLAKDPQRRFKVYATMRNIATNQEDTKTKAGSYYNDTLFIREIDVTKQDTIDKTIKEIIEGEGSIDVLVNNAGTVIPAWWQTAPMKTFYDVMDVNYFGCVRMTKAVAPIMKTQRLGKIIQISSIPINSQYISSKFALEGFSESIAPPLRKFNVWVSVIESGVVATPMAEQFGSDVNALFHAMVDSWTNCPEEDATITRKMLTENPDIVVGTEMQSIDDIAKVVEEVILSPKPDFRYQTSENAKEFARQKFVDPSGNEIMNSWLEQ
ncbi:retinol dehydrogenase 8-like isoform X2 [Amphiura filiformis]|uniref:retinol dehydrogenase 8-like isoform X2 n=1 Tax=Amphiura filiformis TaxID=82378 RepID=UPI003B214958